MPSKPTLIKSGSPKSSVNSSWYFDKLAESLFAGEIFRTRMDDDEGLKTAVADFFWTLHLPKIHQREFRHLFFESGSSIAYAMIKFSEQLKKPFARRFKPKLRIESNNFFGFLWLLAFHPDLHLARYPLGPADEKYSAIFGDLELLPQLPPPDEPRKLDPNAQREVTKLVKHFVSHYASNGLMVMTASGLDWDRTSPFRGIHTGSYPNMLFKRAILQSQCPVLVLLDEDKLQRRFEMSSCFSICDQDLTWEDVCANQPIAFAAALRSHAGFEEIRENLITLGVDNFEQQLPDRKPWSFIAYNRAFKSSGL